MNRRERGEAGSAVVEFVVLAVVLLVPVIYLVLTVAQVQAATYAVTGAARDGARAAVTAPNGASLAGRAQAAARPAYEDFGFAPGPVSLTCSAQPCLTPDSRIEVLARLDVDLPLVPSVIADAIPARIQVEASHAMVVDRFRETPR